MTGSARGHGVLLPFDFGPQLLNILTEIFVLRRGLFPNHFGQSC